MKLSILPIVVCLIFLSCNSKKQDTKETTGSMRTDSMVQKHDSTLNNGLYTIEGDSVRIAPFEIEISLIPKAKQRITGSNETIVIDIYFTGDPIDSSKVQFEEDGTFYAGAAKREINYGEIASFSDIKFPRSIYDQLIDKDVSFNVNVYSGRKSSPDNLLHMDFLDGKLSSLVNKRSKLNGKLIGE